MKTIQLKQLNIRSLDPTTGQATKFFSWFSDQWEQNRGRDIEDAAAMLSSLSPTGAEYEVRTDNLPNRRFSGDGFLSRARYFSLCQTEGYDAGTMRRELMAYHDPMTSGVVNIFDLTNTGLEGTDLPTSKLPDLSRTPQPILLVSIPPFTATEHEWLLPAAQHWETINLLIPVQVTEERFERLIDLRIPQVAAWFTHHLTRLRWVTVDDSQRPAFPNKEPLDQFADLLPSLMVQTLGGGNGATRIAGQWLRSMGADALIFPSARSDSSVKTHGNDIKGFYGWNLVDYRNSNPARLQSYDLTPGWIRHMSHEIDEPTLPIYTDVLLHSGRRRSTQGSWSWQNLEEANRATRLCASALHLYEWAKGGVTAEQLQQLGLMLRATDRAGVLASTSEWFIRAILGDRKLRQAFTETVSEEVSPSAAQLVDLGNAFDEMDARVATGKAGRLI